jgi:hypothetical protein
MSWADAERLKCDYDGTRPVAGCHAVLAPYEPREIGLDSGKKTPVM